MLLTTLLHANQDEVIDSFYNLSNPPKEAMDKHMEKIAEVKLSMGHKYRLARPMPKVKK